MCTRLYPRDAGGQIDQRFFSQARVSVTSLRIKDGFVPEGSGTGKGRKRAACESATGLTPGHGRTYARTQDAGYPSAGGAQAYAPAPEAIAYVARALFIVPRALTRCWL
jgi:hypothetical protein